MPLSAGGWGAPCGFPQNFPEKRLPWRRQKARAEGTRRVIRPGAILEHAVGLARG